MALSKNKEERMKALLQEFLRIALKGLGAKGKGEVRPYRAKLFDPLGRRLLIFSITGPIEGYAILSPHEGTESVQVLSFSPCPIPKEGEALFACPGALLLRKGVGFLDLRLRSIFSKELVPKFTRQPSKEGG